MPVADKVVHFELPADNLERAQNFYRSAFDWSINTVPGMGYTLLQTTLSGKDGRPTEPGAINGGMLARQAPIKNPVLTIQVASIDDSLKQIAKLGGRVLRGELPVGDMGFAAYFSDSEGNVLGLWQTLTEQPLCAVDSLMPAWYAARGWAAVSPSAIPGSVCRVSPCPPDCVQTWASRAGRLIPPTLAPWLGPWRCRRTPCSLGRPGPGVMPARSATRS
jgi:predicted enzyme related to lactoylglutathione lyase